MSQFDFPRINFFGKTSINIATCNNDDFKPAYTANGSGIMVHDIVNTNAYMPPRIYVTETVMQATPGYNYISAGASNGTNYYYVEITPVSTPAIFTTWSKLALGQSTIDTGFQTLYTAAQLMGTDGSGDPILTVPAEWNYNGGMQNVIHDCTVVSVATKPTDNSGSNLYLASNPGSCPSDLAAFLGASFSALNDGGANTAVLCDMNPAAAYTTQYFVQSFYLRQSGSNTALMAGTPLKGVTRWINFGRVVNIPGSPMIASGAVFQAIPAASMTEWSSLEAVFKKYGDSTRTLAGAFVRYDLFEVYENRGPNYSTMDEFGINPAYMSVMGSITPWYEGEMATASMGRVLNPTNPVLVSNNIGPVSLAPITFQVDTSTCRASFDLLNTLPENRTPANFSTYPNGTNPPTMSYELYPIGELDFYAGNTFVGKLMIDGKDNGYTRQDMINNGGMFDYIYTAPTDGSDLNKIDFQANVVNYGPPIVSTQVMGESQYSVQSDSSVGYANVGDPSDAVLSQGTTAGPVVLRVLDRGVPVPQSAPVTMTVAEFGVDCVFNLLLLNQSSIALYDGYQQPADTSAANILLYTYTPPGVTPVTAGSFSGATEFYTNVRVLPDQSAAYAPYYLPPGSPGAKTLDWDALYNEIFISYSMLYPAMTQQLPFEDASSWSDPFTASRLMKVINQNMWNQPWYMPRSRDLSNAQRQLINTWAQAIINSNT